MSDTKKRKSEGREADATAQEKKQKEEEKRAQREAEWQREVEATREEEKRVDILSRKRVQYRCEIDGIPLEVAIAEERHVRRRRDARMYLILKKEHEEVERCKKEDAEEAERLKKDAEEVERLKKEKAERAELDAWLDAWLGAFYMAIGLC